MEEDLLTSETPERGSVAQPIPFAHPSEEEFARLLDFYRIAWLYEPKTFQLEWDAEGNVMEAFTPDFYLPEEDLYVELTTLRQNLVREKNRKLRKLRRLYPEVNIKLFFRRDYRRLLEKYGLLEAKGDTVGQAKPDQEAEQLGEAGPKGKA
jgi:hypoxanthine phosphoribosyltransferase